jgi:thiamine kinase-like enzyme
MPRVLRAHEAGYYLGWAERTERFARPLRERFPFVCGLGRRFESLVPELLGQPRTVIHGEYYPANILTSDGQIYPVDWESAGAGAGTIDLASLTERWGTAVTHRCSLEYQQARWPRQPPAEFTRWLDVARIYLHLRWLGDRPEWTEKTETWRFTPLRALLRRLGVL